MIVADSKSTMFELFFLNNPDEKIQEYAFYAQLTKKVKYVEKEMGQVAIGHLVKNEGNIEILYI